MTEKETHSKYYYEYERNDLNRQNPFTKERIYEEKNPDEIVLEDVKMVHYEVMEPGKAVWLGIYLKDGRTYHLNIGGDNLWVNYSDESEPITIDKDALAALEIARKGMMND